MMHPAALVALVLPACGPPEWLSPHEWEAWVRDEIGADAVWRLPRSDPWPVLAVVEGSPGGGLVAVAGLSGLPALYVWDPMEDRGVDLSERIVPFTSAVGGNLMPVALDGGTRLAVAETGNDEVGGVVHLLSSLDPLQGGTTDLVRLTLPAGAELTGPDVHGVTLAETSGTLILGAGGSSGSGGVPYRTAWVVPGDLTTSAAADEVAVARLRLAGSEVYEDEPRIEPEILRVGDIDGDGLSDVVYTANTTPFWHTYATLRAQLGPLGGDTHPAGDEVLWEGMDFLKAAAIGDADGDGLDDVAFMTGYNEDWVYDRECPRHSSIYLSPGDASNRSEETAIPWVVNGYRRFEADEDSDPCFGIQRAELGDVDGDGKADLLAQGPRSMELFLGPPDGARDLRWSDWDLRGTCIDGERPAWLADLDADGDSELMATVGGYSCPNVGNEDVSRPGFGLALFAEPHLGSGLGP